MYRRYTEQEMAGKAAKKLNVVLFLGSTREGRFGLRVAKFVQKQLEARNYQVELFDPVVLKFPMLEKPTHFYQDRSKIPKWLLECEEKIKAADAYVVVSAEYNHSIPPALSNMLNHFPGSIFSYKPSAIVTYSMGIYGGMRAAMQLRAFLSELGTLSVSNIFGIPEVHKALDENGKPLNDHLDKGADTLLKQLDWMAWAMKNHRDAQGVPK
ncbi:uncharacterized protein LOC106064104 [Biomphalaria glabrata]|uniref:Uncharacterized protein LOC106064104 n=2 Tax=Biomphalaria TaxID=6525 RepID=A0A9W2ZAL8_BIOGL|nr:uncharacterized protein LOC106064104 [Biomphalaria glabrata]KAK0044892.1 FMN-dependent NADPH-azoreductase [Biomphalaria pfeifferi]